MNLNLLKEVLNNIKSARVAVVGDYCLDAYWFIDESKSEISVETGQSTRPVHHQRYSLGGAGNVASNLAAMGVGMINAIGVRGNDPFGVKMESIMKEAGISTDNILVQENNWATHVYIKPYTGDFEKGRIDFGNFNKLSEETAEQLISNLRNEINKIDLVIINQQVVSGIHTEYFRQRLVEIIDLNPGKKFIADSRNFIDHFKGACRKMNDHEALRLTGFGTGTGDIISYSDVKKAAIMLYERFNKPLFVTCGSRGSIIVNENGISEIAGLLIISKVDTVGAGDSYLAGVAAALAKGYPVKIAAELGSLVAGVTVQKLCQTGTASPEEIIRIGEDPDFIVNQEIADDPGRAKYFENTDIEIINMIKPIPVIKHAIFDNDGTISTLREGWETIMAPMMIKAILGAQFPETDAVLLNKVASRVNELIDKTTGIQTLMQMKYLTAVVKEFGIVPENEILDEHGYKKIYNEDLMRMVREREKKMSDGELIVDDFTIKGSVQFLKMLYDSGIKLYLTSGTDVEDVKHEASVLGYDKFFEDRIFGATGKIDVETKKTVLRNILDDFGESSAGSIVTFGDGPVEIRETKKRGGMAIGIASNELRRHGLNQAKRRRLIKAGADLIVPDFALYKKLIRILNIR